MCVEILDMKKRRTIVNWKHGLFLYPGPFRVCKEVFPCMVSFETRGLPAKGVRRQGSFTSPMCEGRSLKLRGPRGCWEIKQPRGGDCGFLTCTLIPELLHLG